jgi:hypothetical protein
MQVGEPVLVDDKSDDPQWLCVAKLVEPRDKCASDGSPLAETTRTILMRTGRGRTPEEARKDAVARLRLVVGTPSRPAPAPLITRKASDPPSPVAGSLFGQWFGFLKKAFGLK